MRTFTRMLMFVAMLLIPAAFVLAQSVVAPLDHFAGHWEGTVQVPEMELKIEVDLEKNSKGELTGTISNITQGLKGLPLSTVAVEGRSVTFVLKAGQEVSTFQGALSPDGKSISGEASQGGHAVPFSLTRTGKARIAPPPKSPAIGKELEGTWNGTLEAGERKMQLILKMANQADGTATGTIFSPEGTGVEIPIAMTQKDSGLSVDVPSVGVSYVGVLSAAGTELVGKWTQGSVVLPLTFRRTAATASTK